MASQQDINYIAAKLEMLSQKYPEDVPDDEQRFVVNFHERFFANVEERYEVFI